MIKNECPCHNCPDRWVDTETLTRCHSTCERHAKWQKIEQERRTKENAQHMADYKIIEHFKVLHKKLKR